MVWRWQVPVWIRSADDCLASPPIDYNPWITLWLSSVVGSLGEAELVSQVQSHRDRHKTIELAEESRRRQRWLLV